MALPGGFTSVRNTTRMTEHSKPKAFTSFRFRGGPGTLPGSPSIPRQLTSAWMTAPRSRATRVRDLSETRDSLQAVRNRTSGRRSARCPIRKDPDAFKASLATLTSSSSADGGLLENHASRRTLVSSEVRLPVRFTIPENPRRESNPHILRNHVRTVAPYPLGVEGVEPVRGVGPRSLAYRASALPLCYIGNAGGFGSWYNSSPSVPTPRTRRPLRPTRMLRWAYA